MQMPVQDVRLLFLRVDLRIDSSCIKYGIMQFSKLDEIRDKGYSASIKLLEEWEEDGRFNGVLQDLPEERGRKGQKRGKSARRNSI